MSKIGQVESVWRYPVKSMRGEEVPEVYAGFAGIYGDRLYAFRSSAAPAGFPFFTGRERHQMLLYRPHFRRPERAMLPPNAAEAEALAPGLNPISADLADLALEVETPTGEILSIDDPALRDQLSVDIENGHSLTLLRSERAMTDCRPISLFSLQTAKQLGDEVGVKLDKRRFRANVYLDLDSAGGFSENALVGHKLQLGSKVVLIVLERDPRCQMITIDPETAAPNPDVLRTVARAHEGTAGIYVAVLVEGKIRAGDLVELLD
jgi:uncharacterized protein